MFWYFFLLAVICLDFGLEWLLTKKGALKKINNETFRNALNFIFKYRVISIVVLVFMSTFKACTVGYDSQWYYTYYNILKNDTSKLFTLPVTNKFEFGFTALCSILALMKLGYPVLLFVVSTFTAITLVLFVNKVSTNKMMSLILFVTLGIFAQSLSAIRQIIAMAFFLLAIMRLIDKKWVSSCVFIILGSLFHISVLVCLIIVPLRYIEPKWWWIVISFVVTIIGSFILPYALQILELLTPIDYYTKYFVGLVQYIQHSDLMNTLYSIALICLFVIMYVCRFKVLKFEEKDKKAYDFFLWIFLFVPLFRIAGFIVNMPQLFNRLNMYFFMVLIVFIPLFVKGLKYNKKLYLIANIAVYAVAIAFMIYLYAVKNSCGVVPFVFNF